MEAGPAGSRLRGRALLVPITLQIVAMVGIGALVYTSAADWFATFGHNSEISGYVEAVDQQSSSTLISTLSAAENYNTHVPAGMLRDPYSTSGRNVAAEDAAAYAAYENVMAINGTDAIGTLTYSALGIALPIYAGTSDKVLSNGVGHIYGSSLPVGGSSTHAVLTSHSGLLTAALFTPLHDAAVGQTFEITTLGETLYYTVESIETVLPDDTSSLQIVAGEDRVTLVTCTPIGVNSHRLLVHGIRTSAPADNTGTQVIAGDGISAGFPWWALIFIGVSGVTAWLLFTPPRGRGSRGGRGPVVRGAGGSRGGTVSAPLAGAGGHTGRKR
jgi:sortase A